MASDSVGLPDHRLLDALGVAVVVFDRGGKVLVANRCARDELAAAEERWLTLEMLREEIEAAVSRP